MQSRLYCLYINVALCSTALQCICRVIRSSMTMKAHTYYIIFGHPPIGGKLPPSPPGGATGFLYTRLRDGRTDRHRPSLYALRYGRGQRKALFKAREPNWTELQCAICSRALDWTVRSENVVGNSDGLPWRRHSTGASLKTKVQVLLVG